MSPRIATGGVASTCASASTPIVLGDFQYAGYKWAYIALGALDLVLGLLLLWRILGRQERIEGGEDEDDEEKGEKGEAELKPIL